jgi:pyrroloquinoline-quinone synthase
MDLKELLNEGIDRWALLRHPFYQAWESGKLPLKALQSYAREYGAFISQLPLGWETVGDPATAREEREHAELWQKFASGLATQIGVAHLNGVVELMAKSERLFATPAAALGALYAFEAQQPATAVTKLEGLRKHYNLPASAEPYFVTHSSNQHEAAKLLELIAALPAAERQAALRGCEEMSEALWNALTDIYDTHCSM